MLIFRYDPLNKFMLLKHCDWPALMATISGSNPEHTNGLTNVFEMIITPELEYPIICIGCTKGGPHQNGGLKLDLINMNSNIDDRLTFFIGSSLMINYIFRFKLVCQ